jgi:hypothetical protein
MILNEQAYHQIPTSNFTANSLDEQQRENVTVRDHMSGKIKATKYHPLAYPVTLPVPQVPMNRISFPSKRWWQ